MRVVDSYLISPLHLTKKVPTISLQNGSCPTALEKTIVSFENLIMLIYFFCSRFVVKDRETFFSSAQRSQIVWQILMRTRYDDDDSDKVGIARLLSNSVYKAAYPLHDGLATKGPKKGNLCSRRVNIWSLCLVLFGPTDSTKINRPRHNIRMY